MTLCLPFQLCSGMFFSTEMAKKMLVLPIEMQLDIFIKIGFGDYFFYENQCVHVVDSGTC